MSCVIEYKGYTGSEDYSPEDRVFFGKALGIRSLVSYEGHDTTSLEEDFRAAVDEYILLCASQ